MPCEAIACSSVIRYPEEMVVHIEINIFAGEARDGQELRRERGKTDSLVRTLATSALLQLQIPDSNCRTATARTPL